MFAFAAMSFYWAAGGEVGLDTLAEEIERQALARDPGAIAGVWVTGGLKVVGGLLALTLVQAWGRRLPRRLLVTLAWIAGIGLTLYAVALLVQHGLMEAGAVDVPESIGASAVRWHLVLWDPWWLLGGLLFTAAASRARRADRAGRARAGR